MRSYDITAQDLLSLLNIGAPSRGQAREIYTMRLNILDKLSINC